MPTNAVGTQASLLWTDSNNFQQKNLSRADYLDSYGLPSCFSPTTHKQLHKAPDDASLDDSTVVFEAEFFEQFQPVSVNDMIDAFRGLGWRLAGVAEEAGEGLVAGEMILINGQRITGKSNGNRDQLRRIAADQVDYIEIIRGTSEEIGLGYDR